MARGPGPSWNKETQPIVEPVFDLGEAASRQIFGFGSLSRSGRWLYATDFRDGLAPFFTGGATVITTPTYQGVNAIKLTTGAVAENYSEIVKYFLPLAGNNLGLETMLSLVNEDVASFGLKIDEDPGSGNRKIGVVRIYINGATKKLQYAQGTITTYIINGLTWVDIADLSNVSDNSYLYHNLKLVIDNENGKYDYVIFDGKRYEIEADLATQVSAGYGHTYYSVAFVVTHEAVAKEMYVDNFIITAETQ